MRQTILRFLTFSIFLLSFLAMNAQEWTLLTPLKSGDLVSGVSFLDELNGYAVIRASGTVIETSDGGVSWREPWTPGISTNLYDVEYVSPDTIFTCGSAGEIFRSIDAGNTWIEMTTPTNDLLYSLDFVDTQLGFASGHSGVLLRTNNGGDDWELLTTNTVNRLMDVEFLNANLGYACGWNGTILKTEDGGDNWTLLDTGVSQAMFEVSVPSENVVYACGWSKVIIKSDDGGESFVTQSSGGVTTINYIHFRDDLNGWAAGDFGLFYTTSNGGNTWVEGTMGSANLHCGDYVSEDHMFVMGVGMMYHSTDNGSDWSLLKNFVPNAKYNGLFFHDDLSGTAVGSAGIVGEGSNQSGVIQTYNGGQTWEVRNQGFSGGWWDVHFADENYGFFIGASNIGKTSDGGQNWTISPLGFDLTGVGTWRHNQNEGLIGGESIYNSICFTNDGGDNFTCNDNLVAKDFFFLDENIGWAVHEGSSEFILKTTDGGETWDYIATGNFSGVHSQFWLDEMTGWIGLGNGGTRRTIDGGETWTQGFAGGQTVGVHFYTPELGFLVDWNNQLFRSDDGGLTWELILGDYFTITPCQEAIFTENYVYTANWGGNIYRAELGCTEIQNLNILGDSEWCEDEVDLLAYNGTQYITEFEWSLPEGWTTEETDAVIEVTAGATGGLVGLTVTNACGLSGSAQLAVSVKTAPEAVSEFTIEGSNCEGESFTLSVPDDENTDEYEWDYPVAWTVIEGENSLNISGDSSGNVSLIQMNDCGSSEQYTQNIEINPLPEVEFNLINDELCVGASQFLGGGSPGGGIYSGEYVSEANFLNLADATVGESLITYTYTDENTCSVAVTDTVFVVETELVMGVLNGPESLCSGESAQFVISGEAGTLSENWFFPEGWMAESTGDTLFVSSSGESGTVGYQASGSCFAVETVTTEVMVKSAPLEPVFESLSFQLCGDESLELNPLGLDGTLVLVWEPGLSVEQNDEQLNISASEPGDYGLEVSQFNECGSSGVVDLSFEAVDIAVQLSFSEDTICLGDPIIATLEPFGGVLEGEAAEGSQVLSQNITESGVYDYTYSYTFFEGCSNTAGDSFFVDICESVVNIAQNQMTLFPNPASTELVIRWNGLGTKLLSLYNTEGKRVKELRIEPGQTQLDLREFASGLYILRDQIGTEQHRIIIQ